MRRSASQQHTLARLALSMMLLIAFIATLALGAAAMQPASEPQPTQRAEVSTLLLPNTPLPNPALLAEVTVAPEEAGGVDQLSPDPFPANPGVTETIRLALESFAIRAALAPEGEAGLASLQLQSLPWSFSAVYMPQIVRQQIQPSPIMTATPEPEPSKLADVAVALWAEPSIRVGRNSTLTYEIRVRNYGSGAARSTHVTLPFDPNHLTPIGSALNQQAGDWVSELTTGSLTVTFGEIGAHYSRCGRIFFRVANDLANNTVIGVRGAYRWSDAARTRSGLTNLPPVLVGNGNDTAAYVWMIVEPVAAGPALKRSFFSDRFLPEEGITTWLNTPSGVRALDVHGVADPFGRVWLEYTPSGLVPATYQMVLYGNRSQLTGVVSFEVQ